MIGLRHSNYMLNENECVRPLGCEGANGKPHVLPLVLKESQSEHDGGEPNTRSAKGVPAEYTRKEITRSVVHKASPDDDVSVSEPLCTKLMSSACGFSVSFAGSAVIHQHTHLITDFVPSADFRDLTARGSRKLLVKSAPVLQFLLGQSLFVLKVMHERGVVHRDLKPENMILSEECFELLQQGQFQDFLKTCWISIIDFGLACTPTDDTDAFKSGVVLCKDARDKIGTPGMRPPAVATEATKWKPMDDVYAMGACFVWILTKSWQPTDNFYAHWDRFAQQKPQPGQKEVTDKYMELGRKTADLQRDPLFVHEVRRSLERNKVPHLATSLIMDMLLLDDEGHGATDAKTLWEQVPEDLQSSISTLSAAILAKRNLPEVQVMSA